MNKEITCPVPPNQRPINQFTELTESWFFSWPTDAIGKLNRNLVISWITVLPFIIMVESGSWELRNSYYKLISNSMPLSFILPILLLIRQWLGWNYILRRLESERIDYEESGWYDGETWEKPIELHKKDLLIAQYEVRPVITRIAKSIFLSTALLILTTIICKAV